MRHRDRIKSYRDRNIRQKMLGESPFDADTIPRAKMFADSSLKIGLKDRVARRHRRAAQPAKQSSQH